MKHTQGEWTYRVVEGRIQVVIPHEFVQCRKILTLGLISSDDCNIPTCCKSKEHANAKLIASAPELLKTLQQLTERIESNWQAITSGDQNGILKALLKESKEAIDKATK